MVLHANPRILFPPPRQYRRGLSRFMHLHENYPIKRAGVAGRALRAEPTTRIFIRTVYHPSCVLREPEPVASHLPLRRTANQYGKSQANKNAPH